LTELGHAVKLSRYGKRSEDRFRKLKEFIEFVKRMETPRLVVDYEGNALSLPIKELETILETYCEGKFVFYLTLASRSEEYSVNSVKGRKNVDTLIKLAESYECLNFSIVVGNKAYLSDIEAKKSPRKTLVSLVEYLGKQVSKPFLIGVEGVLKTVMHLVNEYNIIPFLVFSDEFLKQYELFRSINIINQAVYIPYVFGKNEAWVVDKFRDYLKRRRTVIAELNKREKAYVNEDEILKCFVKKFALFGDINYLKHKLIELKNKFKLIFAYPLINKKSQIKSFINLFNSSPV